MRKARWRRKIEARRFALALSGLAMAGLLLTCLLAVIFA